MYSLPQQYLEMGDHFLSRSSYTPWSLGGFRNLPERRGEENKYCPYRDSNSANLKNYLQYTVCPEIHAGISK
jgi:hypothetical protein